MSNYIVIEGPNGAGKSTIIQILAEKLRASGKDVLTTRQPGATEIGKQLRQMLLTNEKMHRLAELMLMVADKIETVDKIVRHPDNHNKVILCDRGWMSTVVYQGVIGGMMEEVQHFGTIFQFQILSFAKTFVVLPTKDIITARLAARNGEKDRFEGNLAREWDAYAALPMTDNCDHCCEMIHVTDPLETPEQTAQRIFEKLC
jgi:dTMP kinase